MLCSRGFHLVFHFKHDGNVLYAICCVSEDEISLTAATCIIVLFKVGAWVHHASYSVELCAAVNLQTLSNHLGGHVGFQLLVVIYFLLLELQSALKVFFQVLFLDDCFFLGQLHVSLELLNLLFLLLEEILALILLLQDGNL